MLKVDQSFGLLILFITDLVRHLVAHIWVSGHSTEVHCVNPHHGQLGADLWCWDWVSHGLHHQLPPNTSHRPGSSPGPYCEKTVIVLYIKAGALDYHKPFSFARSQCLPVTLSDCPGTASGRHWPLTPSCWVLHVWSRACTTDYKTMQASLALELIQRPWLCYKTIICTKPSKLMPKNAV